MEVEKQVRRDDETEIDLLELAVELLNNWIVIAISTILVAAIAFSVSKFLITPQYESTAELYVLSKSTSLTSLADLQMGTNLTKDYIVVVKGRPVLEKVINNLDLDMNYWNLLNKVEVTNPSDSRILEISVTDPNPERAKLIADEIADISAKFISEKMDQDPPNVIQYGYADEDPISPSVMKNSVIGAMIGFIFAAAIVVITFLFDDSINTAEDIEKKLGTHALGTIPLVEEEYDGSSKKRSKKRKRRK